MPRPELFTQVARFLRNNDATRDDMSSTDLRVTAGWGRVHVRADSRDVIENAVSALSRSYDVDEILYNSIEYYACVKIRSV